MSHYQPYPSYKDSRSVFYGEVPDGWDVVQFKHFIEIQNGSDHKHIEQDEGYPVIGSGGCFAFASEYIYDGESVLLGRKGTIDKPLYVKGKFWTVDTMYWSKIRNNTSGRFAYYTAQTIPFGYYTTNTALPSMTKGALNSHLVCRPSLEEQQVIASFLDRETDRIDTLIAKKTRFIELLKEKRQAVITHAVTKGLDDTVPMKDSGVKWLGMVPAHWEVVPSCWLFFEGKIRAKPEDQHLSATQKYGVIPLAEYEQLEGRQVTHAFKNLEQRKHVEINDFVISMRSFEGGIERVKAAGCVRSSYVVLIAQDQAHIGFFSYLFKSRAYIQGLQATSAFIRDGQDLSYSNFRQVRLPLPSVDEQRQIAELLERTISRIDGLSVKTQRSIELLKEHRAALITAAVTGKIDVREAA